MGAKVGGYGEWPNPGRGFYTHSKNALMKIKGLAVLPTPFNDSEQRRYLHPLREGDLVCLKPVVDQFEFTT